MPTTDVSECSSERHAPHLSVTKLDGNGRSALFLRQHMRRTAGDDAGKLAPAMYLCNIQKDVYSRGIRNVTIATDNPFLSVEDWSL